MGIVKKRAPKRTSTERLQTPINEMAKMKTLMNDLKSAVVNDMNMDKIKQILTETMAHREKLMQNKRTDIKEMFSVFFAHPKLVNIDLNIINLLLLSIDQFFYFKKTSLLYVQRIGNYKLTSLNKRN